MLILATILAECVKPIYFKSCYNRLNIIKSVVDITNSVVNITKSMANITKSMANFAKYLVVIKICLIFFLNCGCHALWLFLQGINP